jgi:hypothetical protein
MELSEYNGWENKFTWLVHLHLSSEEHLMQDYIEQWLEEIHKPTVKLSTHKNYQELLVNYIIPGLGRIKLQALTPQQVQAFYL